ncbi:hypothetical protein I1E95_15980 [Synechococcus sp. CBW1107]|uniref:hypothetical protein n=1 Tax=Synechococcus sp. CBW1107 TaxID=2789857 RepID=UPI0018CD14CC|nr:hypothetical protein [Synechococcus sp. CBW1107]QPN56531.1 hypothetical protein I1E95_15980 [Synechococcus sp. CBW1107]
MPQIDLLLAAELLVVLLLVATMDANSPRAGVAEPEPPVQWAAETDLHAQRILRLESRRTTGLAPLR